MKHRSLLAMLLATAVLVPSVGSAQVGRYKRKTRSVKVKATEKTKKIAPKAKEKKDEARPEITADQFMQVETKVQTIRDEQIQEYAALIKETPSDDPERPDLLFRLAELFAQKQRYWRFRGMEMYTKIDATKNKAKKSSLQKKQKKYFDEEKKWLLRSIKIYKEIADNEKFRDYPRMDEALFYYAYTLQSAKYQEQARKVYLRLIKDFPSSKYIPDAYLSFADFYFMENKLAHAERFYDKVLQFPKSSVYDYALYKKGWVYLNLNRHQDALEVFFKVAQLTKGKKSKATINKASKKDFVRAYSEVGRPQLAYKAFQRVDKKYAFKMLEILGQRYLDQGKAEKTVYVFHELIGLKPKHKMVCEWQATVVRAMLTVGNQDQKVKEIERLVKLYMKLKKGEVLPETEMTECYDNAMATTSELAKIWHQEAEKTLNTETLQYVDKLYNLYMDGFPEADDYGEMQFYYGELLWKRAEAEKNPRLATERWEQAANQYTAVVKTGKVKKELMKDAAYAAVLGWKNALDIDPRTAAPKIPDGESKETDVEAAEEIPERQLKMVAAFDVYIDYIKDPKDKDLVEMKFYKARIYWRHKHFDKAVPLFEDIVKNHIDAEIAEFAVNLLLDSLNRSKRYDDMIKWVNVILNKKDFLEGREELAERLDVLKVQAMRKDAEQLEKDGSFVACGERYREIFARNEQAEGMEQILYNAGVCYEKGKSIGMAIRMRKELTKRFPKSNVAQKAMVLLGGNYGSIAYYPQAADQYEAYAAKYPGEKDAPNAMSNAVFYRKGLGQDDKAIDDTEFFVKKYSKKKKDAAASALFSLYSIYEKRGDRKMVIKHFERYLKQMGKVGGVDRQIVAHVKIGQIMWQDSCGVDGEDGACIKTKKRTRAIAKRKKKGKRSRRASLPTQCGPESKISLTVIDRNRKLQKAALKHFNTALKLWADGKAVSKVPGETDADKAARVAFMTYWVAAAQFYISEVEYEEFLRIKFPEKLNFDQRKPKEVKKSTERLQKWRQDKSKALAETKTAYMKALEFRGGGEHWAIASAARVGQLWQNFSDQLFTAEIPKTVRTGPYAEDGVDAYCDALSTMADPLEKESVGAFAFCLEESTKRNWFNSWSKLCEKELGQIRPLDFPSASELHAEPMNVGLIIDRPDVATEIVQ